MHKSGEQDMDRVASPQIIWLAASALLVLACVLALSGSYPVAAEKAEKLMPPTSASSPAMQVPRQQPQASITIRGHLLLPGRPNPPDARWVIVVTGTLASANGTCLDFTTLTDPRGYYTVTRELVPGDYQWRIAGPQSQASSGVANLVPGVNAIEMGTLRTGDANSDNC